MTYYRINLKTIAVNVSPDLHENFYFESVDKKAVIKFGNSSTSASRFRFFEGFFDLARLGFFYSLAISEKLIESF